MPPPCFTPISQCIYCKHDFGQKEIKGHGWWRCCAAFPKAVPLEIETNYVDHAKPYPGDGGVCFEPNSPSDRENQAKAIRDRERDRKQGWDKDKYKAITDAAIQAKEKRKQSEEARAEQERTKWYKLPQDFAPHPALQYNPTLLAHYQHSAGFWSSDNRRHSLFHEAGHEALLESLCRIEASTPWGRNVPDGDNREQAQAIYDEGWTKSRLEDKGSEVPMSLAKRILEEVGRHAFQSIGEFVAEVYAGFMAGQKYRYCPKVIHYFYNSAGSDGWE